MALTKADIVAAIYGQGVLNKADANMAVERVLTIIKNALVGGDEVLISGFGKWATRDKAQRSGRNPQTGDNITLQARKAVFFKPSRILKARIKDSVDGSSQNFSSSYESVSISNPA